MDNDTIVRELYESFAEGDIQAVLSRLDPAVEWFEAEGYPNVGGLHVGHVGVVEALSQVAADWSELSLNGEDFVSGRDCVLVLGEVSGTYRATQKSFRCRFAHEWRLRDGRVRLWRAHVDTALVQAATQI